MIELTYENLIYGIKYFAAPWDTGSQAIPHNHKVYKGYRIKH